MLKLTNHAKRYLNDSKRDLLSSKVELIALLIETPDSQYIKLMDYLSNYKQQGEDD